MLLSVSWWMCTLGRRRHAAAANAGCRADGAAHPGGAAAGAGSPQHAPARAGLTAGRQAALALCGTMHVRGSLWHPVAPLFTLHPLRLTVNETLRCIYPQSA